MKTKVIVRAPALTRTGYGEHSRFVLRALRQMEDKLDIYLIPVNWGQSNWIWEDNEEREWLDAIVKKTSHYQSQGGQYDVSVQVTIPNEWQPVAPVNIGVTAGIETTKVAPVWLEKANFMNKVVTISQFSKEIFEKTVYEGYDKNTGQPMVLKCETPIEVVHYPVKEYENLNLEIDLESKFNFLTVAQWGPRKNVGNTLSWFIEEFYDNPDVGLVVKTFLKGGSKMDRKEVKKQISKIVGHPDYKDKKCKIYLLHGDFSDEEMHSLYKQPNINAFISLSHGEGFGLPHFEAAYSALPVIAPEWSGYLDFLCMPTEVGSGRRRRSKVTPHFVPVAYDLAPIQPEVAWEGVIEKDAMWAYAQQGSYKMKLREVYKNYNKHKQNAIKLQSWINKEFSSEKQHNKMLDALGIKEMVSDFDVDSWLDDLDVQVTE